MDGEFPLASSGCGILDLKRPAVQSLPLVLASPHSGAEYPADFLAASRLDPLALRRSEDSFVDELFAAAPRLGAPLLSARFPRAYVDVNREAYELDPGMFCDALPEFVNAASPRVRMGLGTIPRLVASGEEIYTGKLRFAEVQRRIERHYRPYHRALSGLVEETAGLFGGYLLVDCHSMPSGVGSGYGRAWADIVLGDCHGGACAPRNLGGRPLLLRRTGFHSRDQRALCRRVHHRPLRASGLAPSRTADRNQPRPLHERGYFPPKTLFYAARGRVGRACRAIGPGSARMLAEARGDTGIAERSRLTRRSSVHT